MLTMRCSRGPNGRRSGSPRVARRFAARLPQVLRRHGRHPWHRKHGRATAGEGTPIAETAERHLAPAAGSAPAASRACFARRADDRRPPPRRRVDYRHTLMAGAGDAVERRSGPRWRPNKASTCCRHRIDPDEGERHLHGGRRTHRARICSRKPRAAPPPFSHSARALTGAACRPRAEPDRRCWRSRHHLEQADREHRGVSADRRCGDRDRRALPVVRPAARRGRRGPSALRVRQADPRPVPAPRALRRRAVRRGVRR